MFIDTHQATRNSTVTAVSIMTYFVLCWKYIGNAEANYCKHPETPNGAITNGQSREGGNIGYTRLID